MPLISKPNYNQIFASQAPDIDKPAVFNNYSEGWGPESRPNNGKPTIKGFNYLQQTSDLKDLWILQNGACLPYDESIEYAEGAPVLKDGVIQYKTASGFKSRDSVTIPTYNSTADGVEPVTGVADGAYFNVRSTDEDTMLVEYQNVGGSAVATGRSYSSSRVVAVDSIADLVTLPEGQRGQGLRYLVAGYHTPALGVSGFTGGGVFAWDASRPKADHNGGTVIDPNKPFPADFSVPADAEQWYTAGGVGQGCFVRLQREQIFTSWFGITPNIDSKFAISAINRTAHIRKVEADGDVFTSLGFKFDRTVEVDFNNYTLTDDSGITSRGYSGVTFQGSISETVFANQVSDTPAYSNVISVDDASVFAVDDYVAASYYVYDRLNSLAYNTIHFIAQIVEISGNAIKIDLTHYFGFFKNIPPNVPTESVLLEAARIYKCFPVMSPSVKNMVFRTTGRVALERQGAVNFQLCVKPKMSNVESRYINSQTLFSRYCRDGVYENLKQYKPLDTTLGGRGYVIQEIGSHGTRATGLIGINARHVYDASYFTSDCEVWDSYGHNTLNYSFGCHQTYVADLKLFRCEDLCETTDFYGGFNFGRQGESDFGGHVGTVWITDCRSQGGYAFLQLGSLENAPHRVNGFRVRDSANVANVTANGYSSLENIDVEGRILIYYNGDYSSVPTVRNSKFSSLIGESQTNGEVTVSGVTATSSISSFGKLNASNSDIFSRVVVDEVIMDGVNLLGSDYIGRNRTTSKVFLSGCHAEAGSTIDLRAADLRVVGCTFDSVTFSGGPTLGPKANISNSYFSALTVMTPADGKLIFSGNEIGGYGQLNANPSSFSIFTNNIINSGYFPTASDTIRVANNINLANTP